MKEVGVWLRDVPISTVVDFGVGLGKMGDRMKRVFPRARLVGCDLHEAAIKNQRSSIRSPYDELHVADARAFVKVAPGGPGTLWVFGDILEHIPKPEALVLVKDSKAAFVLVRIPVGPYPQRGHKLNPAEEHLWSFYPPDFGDLGVRIVGCGVFKIARLGPTGGPYFDMINRPEYERPKTYLGNYLIRGAA